MAEIKPKIEEKLPEKLPIVTEKLVGTSEAEIGLFKALGFYTCPKCGSPKRTDLENKLFCPMAENDCPVLKYK